MKASHLDFIVSGGQTGADRAALDFAIENHIPHRGWCPRGRTAEDGKIPERYQLTETTSAGYRQRTEANVRDSDATVIFTLSPKLTGGSLKTKQFAQKAGRPFLHLHPGSTEPMQQLIAFLDLHRVRMLNMAGSRASKEPDVEKFVRKIMAGVFER